MVFLKHILEFLSSDIGAVYIVGFIGFGVTIYQLNRNFRLKKKAETFEMISNDIRQASMLANQLGSSADSIISNLADAADSMKFEVEGKSEGDLKNESERRSAILSALQEDLKKYSDDINSSAYKALLIIKDIEKSTIVSENSKRAARYLYYEVLDQHDRMKAANSILGTLQVVPLVGSEPNITPESFRAIKELIVLVGSNYSRISSYFNDLEIIVHNDLVKGLYGTAKNDTIPDKHLTPRGIVDKRVESPLL